MMRYFICLLSSLVFSIFSFSQPLFETEILYSDSLGRSIVTRDSDLNIYSITTVSSAQRHLKEYNGQPLQYKFAASYTGLIRKLNANNRLEWFHLIRNISSSYIERDRSYVRLIDLQIANNGNISVLGHASGNIIIPSREDTVYINQPKSISKWKFYSFIATYSSNGDLISHSLIYGQPEEASIAYNNACELHLVVELTGDLTINGKVIDRFEGRTSIREKLSIVKFKKSGKYDKILHSWIEDRSRAPDGIAKSDCLELWLNITFDRKDNLIIYGHFRGRNMKLSSKRSLKCAYNRIDNSAGFLAKYDSKNHLVWYKKFGGRDTGNWPLKPVFNLQNDCYLVGRFSSECILSEDENIHSKVANLYKYYRNDNNLVYAKIDEKGTVIFAEYRLQRLEHTDNNVTSVELDSNGLVHILGNFSGELNLADHLNKLSPGFYFYGKDNYKRASGSSYYSIWKENTPIYLQELPANLYKQSVNTNGRLLYNAWNNTGTFEPEMNSKKSIQYSFLFEASFSFHDSILAVNSNDSINREFKKLNNNHQKMELTSIEPIMEIPLSVLDTIIVIPDDVSTSKQIVSNSFDPVSIKIYPNPIVDQFSLETFGIYGATKLIIIDNNGKMVYKQVINSMELNDQLTFNVSNFAPGVYSLILSNKKTRQAMRLIKR